MGFLRFEDAAKWGWAALIWGAPWSHAAMTAGTFWVTLCALGCAFTQKTEGARMTFRPLLWLFGLMAWQCTSLAWTDNLEWGLQLGSIQMAMLALAFAWNFAPLAHHRVTHKWVFQSAALAMFGTLVWGAVRTGQGEWLENRDWTPWTSHIRLGMLAALGWVWGSRHQSTKSCIGFGILWLVFTAVTGSLTSALLWPVACIWMLWEQLPSSSKRHLVLGTTLGCFASLGGIIWWLQPVPIPFPEVELPKMTAQGNEYVHHPERTLSEGGHRLHLFMCPEEWEAAWSQISEVPLDAPNDAGFSVRDRLPRYLTSLGWAKDGEHILRLNQYDVQAIERGATHAYPAKGIRLRLRELRREWEVWRDGGHASGHALFQRIEYWQTGWCAWMESFWFGHGMGDTSNAMAEAYVKRDSKLELKHRHRAHMQHLTWGISGGLMAMLLWLGFASSWYYTIGRRSRQALWGGLLITLSCFFEDSWETQAGIVICFLALFGAQVPQTPED